MRLSSHVGESYIHFIHTALRSAALALALSQVAHGRSVWRP
jgi:hypothetical protein